MPRNRKAKGQAAPAIDAVLALVRAQIKKTAGAAAVVDLSKARSVVRECIKTAIPVLDNYLLGCGGLPVGRASEWYSQEGGGKSSLGLHFLAATQRAGGVAILADEEDALNDERARVFGVDQDRLILVEPHSTEESVKAQLAALSGIPDGVGPNLMVWDSVGSSIPDIVWAGKDNKVAALASAIGPYVKKIRKLLVRKRCHWMVINQTRSRPGVIFGDSTYTPGGNILKFTASIRVQLFPGKTLKDKSGQHVGRTTTFLLTKSRFSPPYRKVRIRLLYAHGFETEWCVVDHAKNRSVVLKDAKVAAVLEKALAVFAEHGWDYSPLNDGTKVPDADTVQDAEEEDDGLEG